MANFTEMGNGMPNIFNFIPEAGKSGSGINDLAGLLALSKDGNNNDGWGGQWAVWLIFILAFCNGGFGGFGRNGFGAGLGTPEVQSALSNEYLLTAINSASRDNVNFVQNLANQLNCDTNAIQNAINQVSQTVGLGQKDIINQICASNSAILSTVQSTGCSIEQAINQCCCSTQRSIDAVNLNLTSLGYQEQLRCQEQTCNINNNMNQGFANVGSKIDAQTIAINQGFQSIKDMMCDYKIEALRTRNAELNNSVQTLQQYNALQALINPITAKLDYLECIIPPRPVPAYHAYPYGYNNGCNNGCGCSASTTVTLLNLNINIIRERNLPYLIQYCYECNK